MMPQRIRSYLIVNLVLALLMAAPLVMRPGPPTGRNLLFENILIAFYSAVLGAILVGPFGLVELWLYRRKKGTWYEWKHQTRRRPRDQAMSPEERRRWKSEAYRARATQGTPLGDDLQNRTRLFERASPADDVSRPALLMTVADKFEQSGKRAAADRCYIQIKERFPASPQAKQAALRLAQSRAVS